MQCLLWACLVACPLQARAQALAPARAPVVIDSPAWQALMAEPAERDGQPALWAADLLVAWGRPADAARLRRSLLLRHLDAQAAPPPPAATLGQLWPAPVPGHSELAAAQRRALQRAGEGAARATWAAVPPLDDAAVQRLAESVGNRPPPGLDDFVRRWGACEDQGTCPERAARRAAYAASAPEREAARQREAAARQAEQQRRWRLANVRLEAMALAWVLGLLITHLLVARYLGRWLAVACTALAGVGAATWLVVASGPQTGWGGLGLIIVAMALACGGLVLAPLFDTIHRRWFARR